MKYLRLLLVVSAIGFATAAKAQEVCGTQFAPTPLGLASQWIPQLERLDAATPSLSPKEQDWLKTELKGETPERFIRGLRSVERAIEQSKQDVTGLLAAMRGIEKTDAAQQERLLLFLAYALIDTDAPSHLVRLVDEKVIALEAMPPQWTIFSELERSIRDRRAELARHILICVLPAVTGKKM